MRQFACAMARPLGASEGKELVVIVYCGQNIDNGYHRAREALQRSFLHDLFRHSSFNYSGPVGFNTGDNGTITCDTALALKEHGYPYLSHATLSYRGTVCAELKTIVFQPDYHFIQTLGFKDLVLKLSDIGTPLPQRQKKVIWRGAPTGRIVNGCDSLVRARICLLARNITWLDFGIVKHLPGCPGMEISNRIPELDWVQFRGILDIDGNANAWGLFWRLASGSVVFRVESPWTNSYIDRLKPWVHFIPIFENLTNLEEVTRIVTTDDSSELQLLSDIAMNAITFVKPITYSSEVERVANNLTYLFGSPFR